VNKNNESSRTDMLIENNDFVKIMKQSFDFWHKNYIDSPLNYLLIWKKILKSNFEIMKRVEELRKEDTEQITKTHIEQFFEMWSYAIRKSDFKIAKKSMQELVEFWKKTTYEEWRTYTEILQMMENYWKDIQNKNIE